MPERRPLPLEVRGLCATCGGYEHVGKDGTLEYHVDATWGRVCDGVGTDPIETFADRWAEEHKPE